MSIPTEAAELPTPPANEEPAIGQATSPGGFDNTFEGTVDEIENLTVSDLYAKTGPNPFKKKDSDPDTRTQLVWCFTVDGREDDGHFALYTSFSLHEKSGLPPVLKALGKTLEPGEAIRKSKFVGTKVRGFFEDKVSKTGKPYQKLARLLARKAA